jgi:hypothetical protein
MSDTAAFFAKKKTKKKKFKSFNANKIDASSVTTSTHVDAPEISADKNVTASGAGAEAGLNSGDDQWADTQVTWGSNNATSSSSGADSKVAELLDMQALSLKRNEQDDVAERLRIEETKAKLARAKEGMAKEAERLAAEKAEKEAKAAARAAGKTGMGGGSSALGGGGGGGPGGKWVPSHMRSAGGGVGGAGGSRFGMGSAARGPASMDGSGFQKPVDMGSEELFPDLASADKILAEKEKVEKEEQERMASSSQPTRAPAGWGSRMGAGAPAQRKPLNLAPAPAERKPLNLASSKKEEESEPKKEEEDKAEETAKPAAESEATTTEAPALAATPAPAAAEKPKEKKVLKKKKKKDLSTFKPKS